MSKPQWWLDRLKEQILADPEWESVTDPVAEIDEAQPKLYAAQTPISSGEVEPLDLEMFAGEFDAGFISDREFFRNKILRSLGVSNNMFADETGDVAVLEEPEMLPVSAAEPDAVPEGIDEDEKKAPEGTTEWPAFIKEIDNIYRANRSHVFTLHGNVNDYPDNTGVRGDIGMVLFTRYDKYWLTEKVAAEVKNTGKKVPIKAPNAINIACKFTVPNGLVFATDLSFQTFRDILKSEAPYSELPPDDLNAVCQPKDLPGALVLLNDFFKLSARRFAQNQPLRALLAKAGIKAGERAKAQVDLTSRPEVNLTVVWYDTKMCFPNGQVSTLMNDRTPIAFLENWALDGAIACRNKLILVTQRLQDLQESLRAGDSRVASIRVKRPDLEERRLWVKNFCEYIKVTPALINGKPRTGIQLADDITWDILINGAAGMSRVQMEGIFMEHWLNDAPVTMQVISEHKTKAVQAEYGDILDIRQPDPTVLCPELKLRNQDGTPKSEDQKRAAVWSLLGGHDLLKQFAEDWVVEPMLIGDRRRCTRGFILSGPPGTGKTFYGELLAAVCGLNFLYVDFSKLFGGIVGETERNVERLFEAIDALAPCIAFCDEIDLAFPQGRNSGGDSGVGSRMLGRTMKWLSADARWGKVVVIAATNRPDLLDAAFMRAGRFDDILPALPPHPSDFKGRKALLGSICKKSGVRMFRTLAETMDRVVGGKWVSAPKDKGLNRLLFDSRVWTGAEIERLVKLAFGNAAQRVAANARQQAAEQKLSRRELLDFVRTETKNPLIELSDWERAMAGYRPKTREMDKQIDLALTFCNNSEYCPPEWRSRMDAVISGNEESGVESVSSYSAAASSYERD